MLMRSWSCGRRRRASGWRPGWASWTGGDGVFRELVLARIIEPVSKLDSLRVLEEAGVPPAPYRTATRRMRAFAEESWR